MSQLVRLEGRHTVKTAHCELYNVYILHILQLLQLPGQSPAPALLRAPRQPLPTVPRHVSFQPPMHAEQRLLPLCIIKCGPWTPWWWWWGDGCRAVPALLIAAPGHHTVHYSIDAAVGLNVPKLLITAPGHFRPPGFPKPCTDISPACRTLLNTQRHRHHHPLLLFVLLVKILIFRGRQSDKNGFRPGNSPILQTIHQVFLPKPYEANWRKVIQLKEHRPILTSGKFL